MLFRAIQKIVKNGNSCQMTIPRPILFAMNLLPGEQIYLWTTDDGIAHFKKFSVEHDVARLSPGLLPDRPTPERG